MNIGLDLDEVVCSLMAHVLNDVEDTYALELNLSHFKHYDFYNCAYTDSPHHNLNIAEYLDTLTCNTKFLLGAKPTPHAKSTIDHLRSKGHQVHIITARPEGEELHTYLWLSNNNIKVDSVTHVARSTSKGRIGKALALDVFVDDYAPNIDDMLEYNSKIRTFLIDKPWSKGYNNSRVTRIEDIKELLNQI